MDLAFQPCGRRAPTPRDQRRRRRTAVLVTTAVAATAAAGSLVTGPDSAWFRSLRKPSWYPPAATFPVVWTVLHAGIAWASTRALNRAPVSRRRPLASGAALVPYLAWILFATALTEAIWFRDADRPEGGGR